MYSKEGVRIAYCHCQFQILKSIEYRSTYSDVDQVRDTDDISPCLGLFGKSEDEILVKTLLRLRRVILWVEISIVKDGS